MNLKAIRSTKQTQNSTSSKINTYLILIVLVVLALSIVALFVAAETLVTTGDPVIAGLFGGIGAIALVMCIFLLFQSRKTAAEVKLDVPKVMTIIECQNKGCANKTTREFQRGDYVFKDLDVACGKCGGKQMITGIYREIKEKEKTYAV